MRFLSKILVILLSILSLFIIFGFIFNFSVVFPFTITNDLHDVPESRLQAVRLATAATFAYFGIRYIFFQTTKLYPIQFMGIFLFFLGFMGGIVIYKFQLSLTEYFVSFFFLISSIVLYQAGKPEFRNYFRRK